MRVNFVILIALLLLICANDVYGRRGRGRGRSKSRVNSVFQPFFFLEIRFVEQRSVIEIMCSAMRVMNERIECNVP